MFGKGSNISIPTILNNNNHNSSGIRRMFEFVVVPAKRSHHQSPSPETDPRFLVFKRVQTESYTIQKFKKEHDIFDMIEINSECGNKKMM